MYNTTTMNAKTEAIFEVKISRMQLTPDQYIAWGQSDGYSFTYMGDLDTIYHEVENQLDSATTKLGGEENGATDENSERSPRGT